MGTKYWTCKVQFRSHMNHGLLAANGQQLVAVGEVLLVEV